MENSFTSSWYFSYVCSALNKLLRSRGKQQTQSRISEISGEKYFNSFLPHLVSYNYYITHSRYLNDSLDNFVDISS